MLLLHMQCGTCCAPGRELPRQRAGTSKRKTGLYSSTAHQVGGRAKQRAARNQSQSYGGECRACVEHEQLYCLQAVKVVIAPSATQCIFGAQVAMLYSFYNLTRLVGKRASKQHLQWRLRPMRSALLPLHSLYSLYSHL